MGAAGATGATGAVRRFGAQVRMAQEFMMRGVIGVLTLGVLLFSQSARAADLPGALVDPYLQVQAALASDQFGGVAAYAKAIETAATALGKDAEEIAAGARKLGAAPDITAARTAFGEVSAALAAYAEIKKSTFGKDVQLAYCPMADKSWLQKGKDIRNPYYGAAMLTCGSFKN